MQYTTQKNDKVILSMVVLMLVFSTLGLIVVLKYMFFSFSPTYNDPFEIDVEHIRELVKNDKLPIHINTLQIASGSFPNWFLIVDGNDSQSPAVWFTAQVMYDNMNIMIDPVHPQHMQEGFPFAYNYNQQNYDAMQQALKEATHIIATHEHWDHIGGITDSPYASELAQKTHLTKEQIHGHIEKTEFDFTQIDNTIDYDKYYKAFPGIVFIKAEGHTPGGQMIYIKTQTKEYLFIGDAVLNSINLRENKTIPLNSAMANKASQETISAQIQALNSLPEEIHIVIAHDQSRLNEQIREGILHDGFE